MENKEVFIILVVVASVFAVLSIVSDLVITGSAARNLSNNISINFSIITIVLVALILVSLIVELWKKKYEE